MWHTSFGYELNSVGPFHAVTIPIGKASVFIAQTSLPNSFVFVLEESVERLLLSCGGMMHMKSIMIVFKNMLGG